MLASLLLAATFAAGVGMAVACTSVAGAPAVAETPDASRRDVVVPVEPPDAASTDSSPPPPAPSCAAYCSDVMAACKGEESQYGTLNDCLAFCASLTLGDAGDTDQSTVACRAYFASSPAATDPAKYCLAAGPFGGGSCGDRCTAFCQVAVASCSSDAGAPAAPPFPSYADCRTECAMFPFKDAGADGGGEGPSVPPTPGNTLNCREFQLRKVPTDPTACPDIAPDSGICH